VARRRQAEPPTALRCGGDAYKPSTVRGYRDALNAELRLC
jgi:hypothetical protein